ncbi:MAG TPA: hypothetical protein VKZ61_16730 [Thermomicrobiales bacterium]|nr:hypothetical protein [Thermomicrobiales bacterium]
MPTLHANEHPLLGALQDAFGDLVDEGAVDIVTVEDDAEQDACEVQADEWTLFIEGWPVHNAWIALDSDPEAPEAFRTSLEAALGEGDIAALTGLNRTLNGDVTRALAESGDELSAALASMIDADVEDA